MSIRRIHKANICSQLTRGNAGPERPRSALFVLTFRAGRAGHPRGMFPGRILQPKVPRLFSPESLEMSKNNSFPRRKPQVPHTQIHNTLQKKFWALLDGNKCKGVPRCQQNA